jgi:hypothetical protein
MILPGGPRTFGAGALLAMTAETMIPEAFHNSPRFSGVLVAFGFGRWLLVDVTTWKLWRLGLEAPGESRARHEW